MPSLTAYQRRHRPVKRVEHRCDGQPVDGRCPVCGRYCSRRGHLPALTGSLGWHLLYGDGSEVDTEPEGSQ